MTDILVPFNGRVLALSREAFQDALKRGDELMPQPQTTTPQRGAEWVTVAQLAAATGVSTRFWYEQVRTGQIPSRKFGNAVRVPRSYLADIETQSIGRNGAGQ